MKKLKNSVKDKRIILPICLVVLNILAIYYYVDGRLSLVSNIIVLAANMTFGAFIYMNMKMRQYEIGIKNSDYYYKISAFLGLNTLFTFWSSFSFEWKLISIIVLGMLFACSRILIFFQIKNSPKDPILVDLTQWEYLFLLPALYIVQTIIHSDYSAIISIGCLVGGFAIFLLLEPSYSKTKAH